MDLAEGEQAADAVFEDLVDRFIALFGAEEVFIFIIFRKERLDVGGSFPFGVPVAPAVVEVQGL